MQNWGKDFGDVNEKAYKFEKDVKKIDTKKSPSLKNKIDGEKITTVFSKLPEKHSAALKEAPALIQNWLLGFFDEDDVNVKGEKGTVWEDWNRVVITSSDRDWETILN